MNSKRRISFKTLGCKLNQSETEAIASGFKSLGWDLVPFGDAADAVVINSCTVTNSADRKTRAAMNQALRSPKANSAINIKINPAGKSDSLPLIVMTGCYTEAHRSDLESDGRTYIVGNGQKSRIPELVDAHFKGELLPGLSEAERDPFGYPQSKQVFRTRAMVKIQDGCDNFCSFCIIPFVRGRGTSRSLKDAVEAVEAASSSGYREIVLTGVNMSRWNEGSWIFSDLVEACLKARGNFRLRLGSVEPDKIDDAFFALFDHPKMTPHLHLCLQSGSDKILLAMRRQYRVSDFEDIVRKLRQKNPLFNLTTDVIVGFPGEDEEDFTQTLSLCEKLKFGHIHTFPYSRRSHTRADRMPNQISSQVKKDRSERIRHLSEITKRRYRESLIGSVQDVLVEGCGDDGNGSAVLRGLEAHYVPVQFGIPGVPLLEDVRNQIFRVRIRGIGTGEDPELLGEML